MPDLILRPSGLPAPREWSLQLRWHDSLGPTTYHTLCRISRAEAEDVIAAGAASWLFGEPVDRPEDGKEEPRDGR
jgi:hypothetical protein